MPVPEPHPHPTPTPTPRPVEPSYVSPADYLEQYMENIKDACDMGEQTTVGVMHDRLGSVLTKFRNAET